MRKEIFKIDLLIATQKETEKSEFRKLATIRRILSIVPIENADNIELATVDGWNVVIQKNQFNVGDLCIYLEIDSWVPACVAPFLFSGKSYNGIDGARLRTKKIRGVVSQGLILPLTQAFYQEEIGDYLVKEGDDVTDLLSITKWERPISLQLAGIARGNFPLFLHKTDQDRVQNIYRKEFQKWRQDGINLWEVTEKLDGSSMTVYWNKGDFGVCSRNLDLKETESNAFWKMANEKNLKEKLTQFGKNIAIQGELCGPGIQGNKYGLKELEFYVFDIYDIDTMSYWWRDERASLMVELDIYPHVPVLNVCFDTKDLSMEDFLYLANGESRLNPDVMREGIVFKSLGGTHSFKAISNEWLLKYE